MRSKLVPEHHEVYDDHGNLMGLLTSMGIHLEMETDPNYCDDIGEPFLGHKIGSVSAGVAVYAIIQKLAVKAGYI